ncbi:hypothetical protein K523DRAFT_337075 [Schizophyllum commune Tattone D]|nr:hypothetical protein K523DRAFT_337075 [Schizophyllum commune Tattone D]
MYASDEVRDNQEPHTAIACAGSGGTGGGSQDCVRVLRNEPRREKRELVRDIVEVVRDIVEPVRDSVEVVRDIVEPVRANVFRVVSENEVRVGRESSRAGRGVPSGMDLREGRGAGASLAGLYDEGGGDADGGVDTDGGTDDSDADGGLDAEDDDEADVADGGRGVDSGSGVRTCCAPHLDGVDSASFVEDNAGSVCDLGSPGRRVVLER